MSSCACPKPSAASSSGPAALLLVTGPTGSGKTTSLASMINFINDNYDQHIITMEDPIEYYHKHKKSHRSTSARSASMCPTSPKALRRALRMDPDIILVGEMRDLATIHAALEAAETGHVVFGTLHTSGAASTINRIIDVFPKEQQDQIRTQLSTALIGVLSQALLPRKPEGLVAAYEMMVVTPAIQNLIRENKTYRIDSAIQTGRKHGMFLLDESLFRLWQDGLCEKEECLLRSAKPAELAAKIAQVEKRHIPGRGIRRRRTRTKRSGGRRGRGRRGRGRRRQAAAGGGPTARCLAATAGARGTKNQHDV